jgi:hypothetical protein
MPVIHKDLAAGRWHELTLAEQMGNIGSEISRTRLADRHGARAGFEAAVARALELFDLTVADPRWRGRLREILRSREVFCDATLGGHEYGSSLAELETYFDEFALAARMDK